MASVITSVVTATVTATSTTTSASSRVAAQGGILEGSNPSKYDPKNPLILFIIQVSQSNAPGSLAFARLTRDQTGRHHHHLLPNPPLPTLQASTTSSHCRNYRRHTVRSLSVRADTRLHECYISISLHADTDPRGQSWSGALLVSGRAGSGLATTIVQLESSNQRGRCGNGAAFWTGLCDRLRLVSSIP